MMMIKKYLVLTLVVISSPISIYAGKDLMIRECHNAPVPTICMQCLDSDPASVRAADPVAIAGILINCLDSQLHILANNVSKLLSKEEVGDEVKTALEDCKQDLSEAITKAVPDAKTGLKNGDYDIANRSVKLALNFPLKCSENLQTAMFESSSFYSQINIYAQLSDAAMRIIDRF